MKPQNAILDPAPARARHLFFGLDRAVDPRAALQALTAACDGRSVVLGIGMQVAAALGVPAAGPRGLPELPPAEPANPACPPMAGVAVDLSALG